MAHTAHTLLMLLAIICFVLSALGIATPRGNLTAAGLAFWATAVMVV